MSELPAGWASVTLGDVCEFYAGYGFPTDMQGRAGQPLPFYKVRDISIAWLAGSVSLLDTDNTLSTSEAASIKAKPLPPNTIVFAKIGEALRLNRRAITTVPALIDNNTMGMWAHWTFAEPRYLYWYSTITRFDSDARASVVPSIRKSDVEALRFPLAPRAEQTRIVAKLEELLSDLDAGVAELKAAQKKLAQYRQSLLKAAVEGRLTADWRAQRAATKADASGVRERSADYDVSVPANTPAVIPAKAGIQASPAQLDARLRGQDDQEETGADLLARILRERRARWEARQLAKFKEQGKTPPKDWQRKYPEPVEIETRGLPVLPDGWSWVSLDMLCFVVRGASPRPAGDPRFFGGSIPWITVGSLTNDDSIYLEKVDQFVTEAGREASRYVEPGTLLLTNSGATLGVPKITRIGGCINDGSVALLDLDDVTKLYLYFFLTTQTRALRALNQGAAQPNLNTDIVRRIAVPVCAHGEMNEVTATVVRVMEAVRAQENSIQLSLTQSTAQRQNILRAAFAGRLVPQDPNDEPASVLLERIRVERIAAAKPKHPRKARAGSRTVDRMARP